MNILVASLVGSAVGWSLGGVLVFYGTRWADRRWRLKK
jgi:hypothetical protein